MINLTIITIAIAALAAYATFLNANVLAKYSRINIIHSIHQIVMQKSKDCNILWQKAILETMHPQSDKKWTYANTISEITISIQLLNNCLETYGEQEKRDFYFYNFGFNLILL